MAFPSPSPIPRFLLPQISRMWQHSSPLRSPSRLSHTVRHASTAAAGKASKGKPIVLEKPLKFNPPSHGSRLPRKGARVAEHYGGDLSKLDKFKQSRREYPGMMAAQGSWAHWLWTSPKFHVFFTLGFLSILAGTTLVLDFLHTCPFPEMLPEADDYVYHPIIAFRTFWEVLRLTEQHKSLVIQEKRKIREYDYAKRAEYRKAHGIDQLMFGAGWLDKEDSESASGTPSDEGKTAP